MPEDRTQEAPTISDVFERVVLRIEKAPAEEILLACKACHTLITFLKKENQPDGRSALLKGFSKSLGIPVNDARKYLKRRFKTSLKQLVLRGSNGSVWSQAITVAQQLDALGCLMYAIKRDTVELEENPMCSWLEDQQVLGVLFGDRAHATVVARTVELLCLIKLTDLRVNLLLDSALMHVGDVRVEVHKVILAILWNCSARTTRIVLDRIIGVFDVPDAFHRHEGPFVDASPSSPSFLKLAALHSARPQQAAFELVNTIFDTSSTWHGNLKQSFQMVAADTLHKLDMENKLKLGHTTSGVDVIMIKGEELSLRVLDVLVAALLSPFCENKEVFNRLVHESLFHCLQGWNQWELSAETLSSPSTGILGKQYVAHLCCRIVKNSLPPTYALAFAMGTHSRLGAPLVIAPTGVGNQLEDQQLGSSSADQGCPYVMMPSEMVQRIVGTTSQMAMKGAFAVLMEVIRLFPRSNFAAELDTTREDCIVALQTQFDVLQAVLLNLSGLSQDLDGKVMESDDVLKTVRIECAYVCVCLLRIHSSNCVYVCTRLHIHNLTNEFCVYACTCVCICICLYVCMYVCLSTFVCLGVYVCRHGCVRIYVCVYVCMHIYIYVYICIYTCIFFCPICSIFFGLFVHMPPRL